MTIDERLDAQILGDLPDRPELIGVLYERHAVAVFRFLSRRVGAAAAEDLLSEVFASALDARKRVAAHSSGSALPWLYGIATNVVRRHFRKTRLLRPVRGDLGMDWDAVDSRIDAEAQSLQLRAALKSLSSGERELLLMVAWKELTVAEAAEVLGISSVAARSRLHRARQRIQKALAVDSSGQITYPAQLKISEDKLV